MTKLRLSKAEEENLIQVLLSTTPYIAMVIRNSDKVIVAANKLAEEIGVKIGDHCWRVFKKSEHLSAEAQKIASNYKESVPAELGIKCTFCLADDCFIGHPQQHLSKLSVNNRIWDVYWIKISDDLYLHYVIDQTEQLNRETELHLKNIILTTQLDTSLEGILVVDESGKVIIYNRRFVELWGIPDEILSTQRDDELLKNALASVADPEAFINRVEYLYQHPTENSYESIDLRDGRSLERYSAPIFDNSGKYYGRVWYFSDVTDRKRAEASIREREEKYRTLFDNSGDAIFIHDQKGIILSANDVAIRRLGYSYEELICNNIHNIDTPEDATNIPHRILRLLETGHIAFDTVHITKDGVEIPTEVNARLITWSGKQAIMSICRDITTRKQTEAAIQASEQLHSSIIETAMDGFWMVDMQGNLVEVNQTYCQISGYSRHELLAMNIADIEVVEDPAAVKEHIDKIMHNGEDRFVSKHRRKNGDLIHVEVSVQYRKIDGGHMVAFLRDITEQLAAEAELKSSEEKHRYILETAFNGFMLIDKQGNLREVNSTYCQLSGYTKAELLKNEYNRFRIQ